jgi:hypothetical protein
MEVYSILNEAYHAYTATYASMAVNIRKRPEIPERAEVEERVTPIEDIPEDLDPMYRSGDFLNVSA